MFNLWKKYLEPLVFDLENDDGDSPEILKFLSDGEDPGHGNLLSASGTITCIDRDYGLIDNHYSFPVNVTSDKIKVGDEVTYSFRQAKGDARRIVRMELVRDSEIDVWEDTSNEEQIVVSVTGRRGRDLVLSNDEICSLDRLILDSAFTPAVGDVLKLDKSEEGAEAAVKRLHPVYCSATEGYVSEVVNGAGVIEGNAVQIWFTQDVLDGGYEPIVGDKVTFRAIKSIKSGTDSWRAVSLTCHNNQDEITLTDEMPMLYNCQKNLFIEGSSHFGEVILNAEPKTLTLQLVNGDRVDHSLRGCSFRRAESQVEAVDLHTPVVIHPGKSLTCKFVCKPSFVGHNEEVFDFDCGGFKLSCRFEMSVTYSEDFGRKLSVPAVMTRPKAYVKLPASDPDRKKTFGTKPHFKSHFRKPEKFMMPEKIEKAFLKEDDGTRENIEALLELCPVLKLQLAASCYAEKFHTLLFVEEMAARVAVSKLGRSHVFLRRSGEFLVLDVEGLAEQRPSLIVGDRVIVSQPWSERDSTEHVGFIHLIGRNSISIVFHESFHNVYNGTDCDVRFEMGLGGFNHMHSAVKKANIKLGSSLLFPTTLSPKGPKLCLNVDNLVWYNKKLNRGQRLAIMNALRAECRPLPHIIFGPPGTGKTVTVVEMVLQILRWVGSARVLVAAPSNSAADLLAQRLIDSGKLQPGQLLRLLAFSRLQESVPEELAPYCGTVGVDDERVSNDGSLGWHRITVGTCTSLGSLHLRGLPLGHFTHIVIDEAGYATEPQLLIPLSFLDPGSGVVLMAGDPEQLGPLVLSHVTRQCGLAKSFLDRVMARFPYARDREGFPDTQGFDPRLITRLTLNYRSVPEILALPNRLFYNSELEATITGTVGREKEIIDAFHKVRPVREPPVSILFHGVRGLNYQEMDSPSWLNPQEMFECVRYIRLLYEMGVDASEIAVITPYRKQVLKIRQLLTEMDEEVPKVGSVEELQGQERQVVILSCVRSRHRLIDSDRRFSLGFLSNPKRLNVALTRARALLIVLGNPHLLYHDPYWRSVLTYCTERDAYIGCDLPTGIDAAKSPIKKKKEILDRGPLRDGKIKEVPTDDLHPTMKKQSASSKAIGSNAGGEYVSSLTGRYSFAESTDSEFGNVNANSPVQLDQEW